MTDGVRRRLAAAMFSLVIGFAGSIAFLIVYWTSADTALLGVAMSIALGGLGCGFVFWARGLMLNQEVSGPREPLASRPEERHALVDDFATGELHIERRRLFGWMTAAAASGIIVSAASLVRSLGKPPLPQLKRSGWTRGQRLVTADGQRVSVDAVEPRSSLIVFPEGDPDPVASQTVLIRLGENTTNGQAIQSLVAYSRVCTHAGCPVGLYEAQKHLLLCPCHQSTFDILQNAKPTAGPAARPLPRLPLSVDADGYLCADSDFTEPPGPGFWTLPA